jgi:hypothetical protein
MKRFVYIPVMLVMLLALIIPSPALAAGATQFSGTGVLAKPGDCTDFDNASYAVVMSGDLTGCHYSFIESAVITSSGAYNETGTEVFVGFYNGVAGTFTTHYRFTAKYTNSTDWIEVEGRCQHPIDAGSGTGVFEGMTGRLDMRDNVVNGVAINFPYKGHLYPITSSSPG